MKSNSLLNPRTAVFAVFGIGLTVSLFAPRAQADLWDRKTILTVNEPIQIEDKLLEPGTYVLKLLDSDADRNVVQIFNGDQSKLVGTVRAIPTYRLNPTGDTQLTFWETPTGSAKALRAWYYPGDNYGQEFSYPKQLAMRDRAPASPALSAEQESTPPEPQSAVEPPKSTVQPQAEMTSPPATSNDEQQAAEVAQDQQPQETPAPLAEQEQPSATSSSSSADRSADLPQTSTPYPAIGALGLLSLGIFGAFRLKRRAKA